MLIQKIARAKSASIICASLDLNVRNRALEAVLQSLVDNQAQIFAANQVDLERSRQAKLSEALLKRLNFGPGKLAELEQGIKALIESKDPLNKILSAKELDTDLNLYQVSCPLGLIAMIFESRPDALVQIAGLCIKSGNAVVLKGGSEALESNRLLAQIIHDAAVEAGLAPGWLVQLETREEVAQLLTMHDLVDLVIPRGSNDFVQHIMRESRIPVMGHADGICHIFVDKDADPSMASRLVVDSKSQYVAVCNAAETLLIHQEASHRILPIIAKALIDHKVKLRTCQRSHQILLAAGIEHEYMSVEQWDREYLDYVMAIRVVDDLSAAIEHINRWGSHHTDCIVSDDPKSAQHFMQTVGSASVFWNASTRFADGFRFGLGAEVGVSTGKLHARGPVGLEGLLIYQWRLYGSGQIVADYSSGKEHFTHRDLPLNIGGTGI